MIEKEVLIWKVRFENCYSYLQSLHSSNAETIKKYVEMGIGIAIIPQSALESNQTKKIEAIPISTYFGKSQYGVLLRKGKHITTWAKNFLLLLSPTIKNSLS